jgi:dTMP kinase
VARGRLITVEGIDGAGKTTVVAGLAEALRERGLDVEVMREPGSVEAAERIRELVLAPELTIGARAEALLYAAARAQLAEEALAPALAAGRWVLLDRFLDSSLAYQGGGRELGPDAVRAVNAFGLAGLVPDRTILLRVDVETGRSRRGGRAGGPDRLEGEAEAFHRRVAAAYDDLAAAEPERIRVVDAARPPDEVLAGAVAAVADLLPQ